jgi:hypothetical protein
MNEEQKEVIDRYLQEKYGASLYELEKQIKTEVIDYSGTLTDCFIAVQIYRRVYRWDRAYTIRFLESDCKKLDEEVRSNAFQYYFPTYYYKDLPTGKHLGEENGYGFPLLNEGRKPIKYVSSNDVENSLINDLEDMRSFRYNLNKFLIGLYKWIIETD